MTARLEAESTLTDRYQTTVPETVRRALRLGKRDRIRYTIRPDGEVVLSRVPGPAEEDPVMGQFLDFLARDVALHPERIEALDPLFVDRLRGLVGDIDIDLEAPLPAHDE
jgi:antitoxin PrlF